MRLPPTHQTVLIAISYRDSAFKSSLRYAQKIPVLLFLAISVTGLAQQDHVSSKKISATFHGGGEIGFLQNVLEGGLNPAFYLSATPYFTLRDHWSFGAGADGSFGRTINNWQLYAAVRRNFRSSVLYAKVGMNQGFQPKIDVTNLRYRPLEFLSLGYAYSFGVVQFTTEFFHRAFISEWSTDLNTISDRINTFGLRLGIGWEL